MERVGRHLPFDNCWGSVGFFPHSNREIAMSSGSHNSLSNEDFELEGLVNDISRSDSSGSLSAVEDSRSV